MEFEWDPENSTTILVKHGIDFEQIQRLWDGKVVAAPARKVAAAAGGATERSHGRQHTAIQTLLTNDPERLTIMIWKSPEVVRARLVWRTTRNPL